MYSAASLHDRVSIRLARLRPKDDEDDPANHGKEIQQLPPGASVRLVQPPRRHRDAGQKRRERERDPQVVADRPQRQRRENREQHPPPELGPRCAAAKIHVFDETGSDRVDKVHIAAVSRKLAGEARLHGRQGTRAEKESHRSGKPRLFAAGDTAITAAPSASPLAVLFLSAHRARDLAVSRLWPLQKRLASRSPAYAASRGHRELLAAH